jgi:hypothetical protein
MPNFNDQFGSQPDLHQQARIALRDRYGVEPDEDDIQRVCQAIDEGNLTPSAAVSALSLAKAYEEQKAQTAARHVDVSGVLDADFGVVVFVKDNGVAGLARLRAHAALDSLLDQHGISR